MITVLKFLLICLCLLGLYGCEVLGEDENPSSKQMILVGVIEPGNTFLNNKPEGFQLELVKEGELIDTKFLRRDIKTNSYPFEFAGIYPVGELNLRARYLNQYLEFYLGDASRNQGSFLIGKFPMDKAALASRYLKNLSFFPEIQQLAPQNIIDILAYLISIPITQQNNHAELLASVNQLSLNQSGELVVTDKFFPEWQSHPDRFAEAHEIQLAQNMLHNGINIPYQLRIPSEDYQSNNFITEVKIITLTDVITILHVNSETSEVLESNNKVSVSGSDYRLHISFRESLNESLFNQLLESRIIAQGKESLQKNYYSESLLSELELQRESNNSISFKLQKPSDQSNYATHYSIKDELKSTENESQYNLNLTFSIMF